MNQMSRAAKLIDQIVEGKSPLCEKPKVDDIKYYLETEITAGQVTSVKKHPKGVEIKFRDAKAMKTAKWDMDFQDYPYEVVDKTTIVMT